MPQSKTCERRRPATPLCPASYESELVDFKDKVNIMNCLNVRLQASSYLDHQLSSAANQEFLFHINSCKACFKYVDDIRQTSSLLKGLGTATPPPDLARNIVAKMNAAHVCRPASHSLKAWLDNFILYTRPQYVSYATGFILTCLLFTGVIYGFRPKFVEELAGQVTVTFTPIETIELPTPSPIETLPSVEASNALAELTAKAHQTPNKDIFVVADVSTKGQAKLVQLVDGPQNAQFERNFAAALKRASFRPATKDGRPIQSRMLLLIQTIDVRG